MAAMNYPPDCPGCGTSVRLAEGEVERIIAAYFREQQEQGQPAPALADAGETARRLAICAGCADLQYGTTCRYCGCLVAVRARLAGKSCPAPVDRWRAGG